MSWTPAFAGVTAQEALCDTIEDWILDKTAFYHPHPNPPPSMGRVLGDRSFLVAD